MIKINLLNPPTPYIEYTLVGDNFTTFNTFCEVDELEKIEGINHSFVNVFEWSHINYDGTKNVYINKYNDRRMFEK